MQRPLTIIASVQEIVLVALVVILSQVEYDQDAVVQVLGQVQLEAGKYIKKVRSSAGPS
jgi:hypothetical protein